jgi:hypothetical protein
MQGSKGERKMTDPNRLEGAKLAMEEYKVLHAELLHRNGVLIQISAGGIAAFVALVVAWGSGNLGPKTTMELIALVLGGVGFFWWLIDGDARKASGRIEEIEEYVNAALGGDAINPLSWERRFGLHARGYIDRLLRR